MIETKVPKDIRKYKTKFIGPLTLRQSVCAAIAIVLDIIIYTFIIKPFNISQDLAFFIIFILDTIPLAFGKIDVLGMSLEQKLKYIIFNSILSPSVKLPKDTDFKEIEPNFTEKEVRQAQKELKKEIKNHPELKGIFWEK